MILKDRKRKIKGWLKFGHLTHSAKMCFYAEFDYIGYKTKPNIFSMHKSKIFKIQTKIQIFKISLILSIPLAVQLHFLFLFPKFCLVVKFKYSRKILDSA